MYEKLTTINMLVWRLCFQSIVLCFLLCAQPSFSSQDADPMPHSKVPPFKRPIHGNELDVWEVYSNVTKAMNDQTTWDIWTNCLNTVSRNINSKWCVAPAHAEMKTRMDAAYSTLSLGGLHDPRLRSADGTADCSYALHMPTHADTSNSSDTSSHPQETLRGTPEIVDGGTIVTDSPHWFDFRIITRRCNSSSLVPPNHVQPGGASFDVQAWSETHMSSCVVTDLFSGFYNVRCPLHETGRSVRYTVHVLLDFEHFDAYSDSFAGPHKDSTIFKGVVRVLHDPKRGQRRQASQATPVKAAKRRLGSTVRTSRRVDEAAHRASIPLARAPAAQSGESDAGLLIGKLNRISNLVWGEWVRHEIGGNARNIHISGNESTSSTSSVRASSNGLNFGAMADYRWHGSGSAFIPESRYEFERIFGKDADDQFKQLKTFMLGESHMRYIWDLMYYLYSGGSEGLGHLAKKHGSTDHIAHVTNTERYHFVTDLGDLLLSESCPPVGSTHIYVIQFGSWDLGITSLRNVMANKANIPHLIKAVEVLVDKCGGMKAHESTERGRIHFIWLSPNPELRFSVHPGRKEYEQLRHGNNNYAINAITQKVHAGLINAVARQIGSFATNAADAHLEEAMGQDEKDKYLYTSAVKDLHITYEYIDVKWIAGPRIRLLESVCGHHLLCHPDGESMMLTAAGIAIAGEVLTSIARHAQQHAHQYNIAAQYTHTSTRTNVTQVQDFDFDKWHMRGADSSKLQDMLLHVQAGTGATNSVAGTAAAVGIASVEYFYRAGNGLRRLVPDTETLRCLLGASPDLPVRALSAEAMDDIPLIATPLPSRKPGKVYSTANMRVEGQAWVMTENCTRKKQEVDANAQAILVFEYDIYDIPEEV